MKVPIYHSDFEAIISRLHATNMGTHQEEAIQRLANMKADILKNGLSAINHYTQLFDHITDGNFQIQVTDREIQNAYQQVSAEFVQAIKIAKSNIERFHEFQVPKSWNESVGSEIQYGLTYTPIHRVGIYVPGGRAVYPSTVLMNVIPAKIAQVSEVVMVSPPRSDGSLTPEVLVAADLCGVKQIFKVGGAQAVFGLAFGCEAFSKVDKIVGPGNMYVTMAKQMVYGLVDIDKPAGPSEVLIYIQDKKYAQYAAADMLAQLEHDPLAIAIGVSEHQSVLDAIQSEISVLLSHCSRQEILSQSIQNAVLFLSHSQSQSIQLINQCASEHLVLCIDNPEEINASIQHAGAVFLGPFTPVTLGDYYAGPNHVLPTSGTARFASPLGVLDFMKSSTHLRYSKQALQKASEDLKILTSAEGLDAHYSAVSTRLG